MITDNLVGFVLVCGVIPLCFVAASNFNSWLYSFWINQLERHDETPARRLSTKENDDG